MPTRLPPGSAGAPRTAGAGASCCGGAALQVRSVTRHRAGAVSRLVPPGDEVHAMHNPTTRDTGEIHVYGRDLDGLRRKTWAPDGRVSLLVSPKYINC